MWATSRGKCGLLVLQAARETWLVAASGGGRRLAAVVVVGAGLAARAPPVCTHNPHSSPGAALTLFPSRSQPGIQVGCQPKPNNGLGNSMLSGGLCTSILFCTAGAAGGAARTAGAHHFSAMPGPEIKKDVRGGNYAGHPMTAFGSPNSKCGYHP